MTIPGQYFSEIGFPLTQKPLTPPDKKNEWQDIFNLQNSFRLLVQNLDEKGGSGLEFAEEPDWVEEGEITPPGKIERWAQVEIEGELYYVPLFKVVKPSPIVGDPHWDDVAALLHFGGDLVDETGRVWTGNGAFSYVGGRFGFGFTSGGGWVSTPTSTDLNLSTGDFTIECFMDLTGTSGLRALLSSGVAHWVAGNIYILVDGTNRLEIGSYEAGHIWISSATLPNSGTFHFCLERLAGELRLFVEGVLVDSKLSGVALNFSTSGTQIGVNSVDQNPFSGVIDELRITKGVARYTEDFDPPTEPFPNFGP